MTTQLVKGLSNLRQLADPTKVELIEGQIITLTKKKRKKCNETDLVGIFKSQNIHKYLLEK